MVGLRSGARLVAPEVVGAADVAVFACLIEVVVEILVEFCGAFGRFDDDESQGATFDHGVSECVPIDFALVV